MNINALLGTISFVLWSSFSVWFYVNNIYEFDTGSEYVAVPKSLEVKSKIATEVIPEAPAEGKEVMAMEETKVIEPTPVEVVSEPIEVAKPAAINISKEFNFDKNSDQIKNAKDLEAFVNELKATLTDQKVSIQIVGYTCDLGSNDYNQTLGLKRAKAISQALSVINIDEESIRLDSKGEESPKVPNDTENNRTKNRRVTVIIKSTS